MKIDVIDAGLKAFDQARVVNYSDKIFVMDIKICNAVQVLIDNIVNYVSATGAISFLRFWGHGNPGVQYLGNLDDVDDDPADNNAFWRETVKANTPYLEKLGPLFAPGGIIELHGCSVAEGTTGEMFLCKFAHAVNVPVVAQDKIQGIQDGILDIGSNAAWEPGLVTMAWPDYAVTYGPGSTL